MGHFKHQFNITKTYHLIIAFDNISHMLYFIVVSRTRAQIQILIFPFTRILSFYKMPYPTPRHNQYPSPVPESV